VGITLTWQQLSVTCGSGGRGAVVRAMTRVPEGITPEERWYMSALARGQKGSRTSGLK